jgi:hypothetical protein
MARGQVRFDERTALLTAGQFNINQRDIEGGNILNQSGFARGSFNYRIESVGLNFVRADS